MLKSQPSLNQNEQSQDKKDREVRVEHVDEEGEDKAKSRNLMKLHHSLTDNNLLQLPLSAQKIEQKRLRIKIKKEKVIRQAIKSELLKCI